MLLTECGRSWNRRIWRNFERMSRRSTTAPFLKSPKCWQSFWGHRRKPQRRPPLLRRSRQALRFKCLARVSRAALFRSGQDAQNADLHRDSQWVCASAAFRNASPTDVKNTSAFHTSLRSFGARVIPHIGNSRCPPWRLATALVCPPTRLVIRRSNR